MKAFARLACLVAYLPAAAALAADFDGSKALICAPVEASDCSSGGPCVSTRPVALGAPAFFRVDFARKSVTGPKRKTQIQFMEKSERQLLMQGSELGFGWTLALDMDAGTMTLTLVDRESAAVLFGSCTPL